MVGVDEHSPKRYFFGDVEASRGDAKSVARAPRPTRL
jgi:hypothetical protein